MPNRMLAATALVLWAVSSARAQTPNSWTMGAPMPTPRSAPFTGVIGEKIYVAGGVNGSGFLNVNEVYDTATNTWTTAAPMPTARAIGAGAVVGNIFYAIGGGITGGGNAVDTVEAYDPSTDTWSAKAPVPVAINSMNAIVAGGIVYIVGGFSNGARLNDVFSYNPATDSWSKLAALEVSKSNSALGLFGGQIVSAGGLTGSGATADTESYSIAGNAWTTLAPLPVARQGGCFGTFADTLYLAGGANGSTILNTTIAYNEPTNSWQSGLSPLPTASAPASAALGDQLYCFGGASTTQIESSTIYYDYAQIYLPTLSPAISPTGVVSASAFGEFSSIAPGSWIEIYGINLAKDTRGWTQADFTGLTAPTMLDGTSVTIGGQSAFIDYISPGQVNALVPFNVPTGLQQMSVTTGVGTSAAYNITVNATEPGFLAITQFNVAGIQYAVAFHADGTYVIPVGAIAGLTSRPALPGETISLYGVGFGPVTPSIPAGQLVQELNMLSLPLQMQIGGLPATTPYDGLAPSYTGLYQINMTIPSGPPSGNQPLTFTINGVSGTQTLYLSVGQ